MASEAGRTTARGLCRCPAVGAMDEGILLGDDEDVVDMLRIDWLMFFVCALDMGKEEHRCEGRGGAWREFLT